MNNEKPDLFDDVIDLPDPGIKRHYEKLVGLDNIKNLLQNEASLILNPSILDDWCQTHYKGRIAIVDTVLDRPTLFLFAGDIGTGKTTLAKSFGDPIARKGDISLKLYSLSLSTRGSGGVGEMTNLLTNAFAQIRSEVESSRVAEEEYALSIILLIDEADALAQSREISQMHHEDRAGVNALIRGIDQISIRRLPIIVVMCTNRLEAIDPAIVRRAAAIFDFKRPNDAQRREILNKCLEGVSFSSSEMLDLVQVTGPTSERDYGFTYSDITLKLIPTMIVDAIPNKPILLQRAIELAKEIKPTPPFKHDT